MKKLVIVLLVAAMALEVSAPAFAARRVVVRTRPNRTTVVVHRGWPIKRRARVVVVRPARVTVRVNPRVYLAPVVFTGVVIAVASAPKPDVIVWEDGETLNKEEDWTEFTLNCDTRGEKLWIEIASGKVQVDWAEAVFENGDATVVDFNEKTHGPGLYSLLDFKDGRKVDHVRVVARAKSDEAKVVLRIQK